MSSSYDGIVFDVIPNGSFFANPVIDENGLTTLDLDVLFSNVSHHNSIINRVSICTPKRNLGSLVYNVHVDYGVGAKVLIVATGGGKQTSYASAILTSFSGAAGYGREAIDQYKASLKFLILGKAVVS